MDKALVERISLILIIALLLAVFCFGCTTREPITIDQSDQTGLEGTYDASTGVYCDCPYGPDPQQKFDFALPQNKDASGLYVFVHGGAWISGDKDEFRDSLSNAASVGYVAASINYRFISESVHMDDILEDLSLALGKIKSEAETQGINLDKVAFAGLSAGAHIALLYSYKCLDEAPIRPVAVISYSAPTDLCDPEFIENSDLGDTAGMLALLSNLCGFSISEEDYKNQTGNFDEWSNAVQTYSPVYWVTEKSVPTVLAHGKKDTIVPFSNAIKLDEVLTSNNVTHQFVVFPESGHNLDKDLESKEQTDSAISHYIQTYLNN